MSEKYKNWLESEGIEVLSPTRETWQAYRSQERRLVREISSGGDSPAADDAQDELLRIQNELVASCCPGRDVVKFPADMFRDVLNDVVGRGFGSSQGN